MQTISDTLFLTLMAAIIWIVMITDAPAAEKDPKFALGTISFSYHYDRRHNFNEKHNGLFLSIDHDNIGFYENSEYTESIVYFRNQSLYGSENIFVTFGGALGYTDVPLMPLLGLTAKFDYGYITVTPVVAFVGLRLELN